MAGHLVPGLQPKHDKCENHINPDMAYTLYIKHSGSKHRLDACTGSDFPRTDNTRPVGTLIYLYRLGFALIALNLKYC